MTYQRNGTPDSLMAPLLLQDPIQLLMQEQKSGGYASSARAEEPASSAGVADALKAFVAIQPLQYGAHGTRDVDITRWHEAHRAAVSVLAQPAPAQRLKDHQIAKLVNDLRDVAKEYGQSQQLRERIAEVVRAALGDHTS
ncbi:hypothetical protein GFK26_18195 [Variovorax paradoxus]|uniref:Uncharacterized protein n=1 Tax=Variovorax paradoxus TaxID=34073 RepID=A0A5Q0M488_VARPD|nr:hypothetical protein [Variovorax paradoxus]QFZ84560.1 hypothetical protein GFK26_18195 [Variovorax paradoxus]